MASLCRHLSPTAKETVNWVTTADGGVHTADATQLDSRVASAVCRLLGFIRVRRLCLSYRKTPVTTQVTDVGGISLMCRHACTSWYMLHMQTAGRRLSAVRADNRNGAVRAC